MRAFLLLAAMSIGGCCWERTTSCVETRWDRCYDGDAIIECADDDYEPLAPDNPGPCGADWTDGSCADHGYTVRCSGYAVRPGTRC